MGHFRIDEITIHNFRCFNNISFKLGKYVTVIAGQNATGKSTILCLLGHCAELRSKYGKPILKDKFRTEFTELIKASQEFDKITTLVYTINFIDEKSGSRISIPFRSTWQKYKNGKRFRLIPKRKPERKTERKVEWPTLYLGLSRLYPIGESEQLKSSNFRLPPDKIDKLLRNHKEILSLNDDPIDCSEINIKETTKKTVGIITDRYDSITNSAGQDNLSQILIALMSFELLKEHQGENWKGGLLLIDELDATLHPAAQNKLLNFIYDTAKELQIQIVFTTHSLNMLHFICEKTNYNKSNQVNPYELVYLTTKNNYLEVIINPNYNTIYYDLLNELSILPRELRKVTVYTEDDEARWFLKKLLGPRCAQIKLPNIHLGCDQLLKLLQEDYNHFKNTLFVLDGDVEANKLEETARRLGFRDERPPNVLILPGQSNPEKVFFDFLDKIPGEHELYQSELAATGLSKRTLHERGPYSYTKLEKERDKFKYWFNDLLILIECIYPYWEKENEELIKSFLQDFIKAFNKIANRMGLPKMF